MLNLTEWAIAIEAVFHAGAAEVNEEVPRVALVAAEAVDSWKDLAPNAADRHLREEQVEDVVAAEEEEVVELVLGVAEIAETGEIEENVRIVTVVSLDKDRFNIHRMDVVPNKLK